MLIRARGPKDTASKCTQDKAHKHVSAPDYGSRKWQSQSEMAMVRIGVAKFRNEKEQKLWIRKCLRTRKRVRG